MDFGLHFEVCDATVHRFLHHFQAMFCDVRHDLFVLLHLYGAMPLLFQIPFFSITPHYLCLMAKATLEYDLNDPDDVLLHKKAVNVRDVYSFLWEYDQWLRGIIKYQEQNTWPQMDDVREKFHQMMNEHGVNLE